MNYANISEIFNLAFFSFIYLRNLNKVINLIGASVFSTYLIHQHPLIIPYFTDSVKYLFNTLSSPVFYVAVFFFSSTLLFLCCCIDKIRIFIWNSLLKLRKGTLLKNLNFVKQSSVE